MFSRFVLVICITMTLSHLTGCVSAPAMQPNGPNGILGTPRFYAHPKPLIFRIAQDSAQQLGLVMVKLADDQSYFIARKGLTALNWGTWVGVYLLSQEDDHTLVVIRTDPVFAANLVNEELSAALHAAIQGRLTDK